MIRGLALAAMIAAPQIAAALPVSVTSGEHDGFTRLVMTYEGPVEWQMGRTADGYALQVVGAPMPYDLSATFDVIGKSRLAAIWVDPQTHALQIGIGCACHAIPFEFRPGIIVVDLRDGSPPPGSSFELALDGAAVSALSERPRPRPKANPREPDQAGYDWMTVTDEDHPAATEPSASRVTSTDAPAAIAVDAALQPLRASLLLQLSQSASMGMIDMTLPPRRPAPAAAGTFPSTLLRIGEMPGVAIGDAEATHAALTPDGTACMPADALDFASWGSERPIAEQMADAMTGLTGEFDQPDPAALSRAVRFYLFLGFGEESQQLMRAFSVDAPDVAGWKSLAHLLDDTADPAPAFRGQADCDTPAALWAVLTDPAPAKGDRLNRNAALLAFSALPIHLRRLLGPKLATRFLALDDAEAARAIRDAILRAPGVSGAEIALLQARMQLDQGDAAAAQSTAEQVLNDAGPSTGEALIALVETRIAQLLPIEASVATALEAMIGEHQGTPEEPRFRRALALARAASGDFTAAFAEAGSAPDAAPLVWQLLASLGTDAALIDHAILPHGAPPSGVDIATAQTLAERLIALGFADQARQWMVPESRFDPILRAKAELGRHDPAAALRLLAGSTASEAQILRAEAHHLLGDDNVAAVAYAAAGDDGAGVRAKILSGDWPALAASGPDIWSAAARTARPDYLPPPKPAGNTEAVAPPSPVDENAPLARSRRLLDSSAATREALLALLAEVPVPSGESQ